LMLRINTELPADLVQLCKKQGAAMVMAGSSAEYRRPEGRQILTENSPLETEKTYGASKARGTTQASGLANETNVPLRVLRLFNVYGPGEPPHRLLPSLVSGLAANQRIALSEGSQVRDFVYVGDVVEALLAAADHAEQRPDLPAAVWNVATEEGRTVREFAQITARLSGQAEHRLGFGDLPMRADEIEYLVGSSALIRAQTGWAPRHNLTAGIEASLAQMADGAIQVRAAQ
ncbi:MAG: NAD(P)-dependent oxidoreductase, partial [Bradyrhizobium sp.]